MALANSPSIAIVGDVHGHLQLALCTLARWQRERGRAFSAALLCGDVGTFTDDAQLDSATRKHARDNPCELEFLTQWSMVPQAPWLDAIFRPEPDGLGLQCPVVMVHGNHEGFLHLTTLYPHRRRPAAPVAVETLPAVDTNGHILFLPPGWTTVTADGVTIAGVGGMEAGQRRARYHDMAYIEDDAVEQLMAGPDVDILLTHQGPAQIQGSLGSPTLDLLLERKMARFWFHGHATPVPTAATVNGTCIVPLGDLAFRDGLPGLAGWSILDWDGGEPVLHLDPPPFWREVRMHHWHRTPGGRLVHPDLARFVG